MRVTNDGSTLGVATLTVFRSAAIRNACLQNNRCASRSWCCLILIVTSLLATSFLIFWYNALHSVLIMFWISAEHWCRWDGAGILLFAALELLVLFECLKITNKYLDLKCRGARNTVAVATISEDAFDFKMHSKWGVLEPCWPTLNSLTVIQVQALSTSRFIALFSATFISDTYFW